MYQAFVKLFGHLGNLGLVETNRDKVQIHLKDKHCALVKAGKIINVKDDTEVTDNVLQANQMVIVYPEVPIKGRLYRTFVSYNKQLSLKGIIISPISIIVRAGEEDSVGLVMRASKKTDLSQFEHIFELYQID